MTSKCWDLIHLAVSSREPSPVCTSTKPLVSTGLALGASSVTCQCTQSSNKVTLKYFKNVDFDVAHCFVEAQRRALRAGRRVPFPLCNYYYNYYAKVSGQYCWPVLQQPHANHCTEALAST